MQLNTQKHDILLSHGTILNLTVWYYKHDRQPFFFQKMFEFGIK